MNYTAQQDPFNIQAYQTFLDANKNLSAPQLMSMHPAPLFRSRVKTNALTADFLDSVRIKYKMTQDELNLLAQNGFVVSERLSSTSFGEAFADIYHKDIPVFITTDAILHALHKSYDDILITTEENVLNKKLETSLLNLHTSWKTLEARYGKNPDMQKPLNDIDIYLTVAKKLAGLASVPNRFENSAMVNTILNYAKLLQPASITLFSDTPHNYDFSQLTPRGHYTRSQLLTEYFQAMMWLGRTELMLSKPNTPGMPTQEPKDIQRQTINAYLLLEAAQLDSTYHFIGEMDRIIKFLVGESDNVTMDHLIMLRQETGFTRADELFDQSTLERFQSTLKTKSYAVQRILSQILMRDPFAPGKIESPSAFLILGQRFIIDSYVMGSVVFDKIEHNGQLVFRELPSSLDPLFALGNNATAQLLQNELNQYYYAPNLAALRYLIDSYENDFWNATLYNTWLQSIRTLHPQKDLDRLPSFMQTGAWWQEKTNTQLASWAQLRHDNLLYAKQSYTGGVTCSYPHSYVEPFPEFYKTISAFAAQAKANYSTVQFSDKFRHQYILTYFDRLATALDTLSSIAQKELDGIPISNAEELFLKRMLFIRNVCGTTYDGWYPQLFYSISTVGYLDYVIADVHTAPTDAAGNPVGHVLHVGTGDINLGIITAPCDDGTLTAFVGPMLTYLEEITSGFKRLTDEEWLKIYKQPPVVRPAWVNVYLADRNGNSLAPGPKLITDDVTGITPSRDVQPNTISLSQNYPNPFGSTLGLNTSLTVIRFDVSTAVERASVQLSIYDVTGKKIRTLIDEQLPAGNYSIKWDGKNNSGGDVSSGLYFYRLVSGNQSAMRKMAVVR